MKFLDPPLPLIAHTNHMKDGKNDNLYQLVYSSMTLALILPLATTTVEMAFLVMNIVKNRLRNRMEDQLMNTFLITYIHRKINIHNYWELKYIYIYIYEAISKYEKSFRATK